MMLDPHLANLPSSLPEAASSIEALYLRLSGWLEAHLAQAGTLIAGTTFSLYARNLGETVRRFAKSWPFILRVGLFVGLVGFGFGLIIATIAPVVTAGLRWVGTPFLVPAILAAFIVIGILAERNGRI
ncbi:DUF3392 family protein [Vulgatibacter incomptus]|uniref:Uncharacterized protein n=1 Tax=Vulgatibacter incomptus TaxID=1391653 RepID=A0A0K1PEZ3_9BACT|nr:DUF3392 family protein [Vulgatibacter incomptus]AKU91986.1 hypothetical protein AKJ08_2373 [Vulgatibacter incomptus]